MMGKERVAPGVKTEMTCEIMKLVTLIKCLGSISSDHGGLQDDMIKGE